jgi:putative MATE family efflux protein
MKEKNLFAKYVFQQILGSIGLSCYVLADTFFISIASGADGITALNLTLPVYSVIYAIGAMIGVGSAIRFSIQKARKAGDTDRLFSNALLFDVILGIPFIAAGIFLPDTILGWMGADAQITAVGTPYIRIFMLFTPFFMANYAFNAFVRNDGDPTVAMSATVISSLFNIVFDWILMFPLGMGMAGAALATAISPVVGILICFLHFHRKENTIHLHLQKPDFGMLGTACRLGFSSFAAEIASGVSTLVYNLLILDLAGNAGVAAYGVIANVAIVATSIFNGIAQGTQPLFSDAYGRGREDEVKQLLVKALKLTLFMAVLICLIANLFPEQIVAVFNSTGNVKMAELGVPGVRMHFTGYLAAGVNILLTSWLSSTEQIKASFAVSLCRGLIVISLTAVIMAKLFGMTGIWFAFLTAESITFIIYLLFFRKKNIPEQA